jgi:hypothetical protein
MADPLLASWRRGMKVDQALVDACYRHLTNKDFYVSDDGISFSASAEDLALIRGAGEKKLKKAFKLALERKNAEDVRESGDGME